MDKKHAPLPWKFNPVFNYGHFDCFVGDKDGNLVAHVNGRTREEAEANRDFIERAVNSYEEES